MTATAKVTKINVGIYRIDITNGPAFEVERWPDGEWLSFYLNDEGDRTDFISNYLTKRDAINDIVKHFAK